MSSNEEFPWTGGCLSNQKHMENMDCLFTFSRVYRAKCELNNQQPGHLVHSTERSHVFPQRSGRGIHCVQNPKAAGWSWSFLFTVSNGDTEQQWRLSALIVVSGILCLALLVFSSSKFSLSSRYCHDTQLLAMLRCKAIGLVSTCHDR